MVTKINLMSDLHLEHHKDQGKNFIDSLPERKDTVLVLAGDITSMADKDYAKNHLGQLAAKAKHTFMVLGNHELYGTTPQEAYTNALQLQFEIQNFTALTAGLPVEYDGHRFIGDTMWFPYDPTNRFYENQMSDFRLIKHFKRWVYDQHDDTVRKFNQNIKEGDIVITHHLPHKNSIHKHFIGDSLNCFFYADMSGIIHANKPAIWIHGHTHCNFYYTVEQTRVICNAAGYPREHTGSDIPFNPYLTIEV
jgi:predicted phosphodiesterase